MITGYNTDVEHGGVVYHVQTEDKGLESPIVLSLVYSGGAILAAKRSSYADLIATGFQEGALAERLKRQHRLICAAIHAGRVDELKQLSKGQTGRLVAETVAPTDKPDAVPFDPFADLQAPIGRDTAKPAERERESRAAPLATPVPAPPSVISAPRPEAQADLLMSSDRVMEPPASPNPTTPSPYSTFDPRGRSRLGDVMSEPDGLRITLLGHDPDFHGGENIQLKAILTRISQNVEEPLGGAAISVKILGTTFRPVLFSLKTDHEGVLSVATRIPPFLSGRAAIVVKATASDLSAEARWVIHPGK